MVESTIDPITSTVIQNRLGVIVEEAGNIICRLSGSPIASQFHDMQTALLNANGEVLSQGLFLIFHSAGLKECAQYILREYQENPGVNEDDMFICNNPYEGATHQSDIIVIAPIHYQGRLVGWAANTVHQIDVGGPVPGQAIEGAQSIYEEQIPMATFKIIEKGVLRKDLEREFLIRSRFSALCRIDFKAMVAANNATKSRFRELFDEYGMETVLKAIAELEDLTETKFRDRLKDLPDGIWRDRSYMEHEGKVYCCNLEVTKRGDSLIFDFDGTDEQAPAVVNSPKILTEGWIVQAILTRLCFGGIPWCPAGLLRPITIKTNPGTIVDCTWPAGVARSTSGAAELVRSSVGMCLSKLLDASEKYQEYVLGGEGGGVYVLELAGINQYQYPFQNIILDGSFGTGIGARSYEDGLHSSGPCTAIDSLIPNVETMELLNPVLYLSRRNMPNGSGSGKFIGGDSLAPLWMPYGVERIDYVVTYGFGIIPQNHGISGGYPGMSVQAGIKRNTDVWDQFAQGKLPQAFSELSGELETVESTHRTPLNKNDVYWTVAQCSAGGYGDPIDRDPELVLQDFSESLITDDVAGQTYGVIIIRDKTNRLAVDGKATENRRREIRGERKRQGIIPKGS
ncbi:hydantoinase B/oxoprolinase family protein [Chloroflexota bacterium]